MPLPLSKILDTPQLLRNRDRIKKQATTVKKLLLGQPMVNKKYLCLNVEYFSAPIRNQIIVETKYFYVF